MLYNQEWDKNSVSSILRRAADVLDEHGLTKDRLCDGTSFCAIGAIMNAMGMTKEQLQTGGWSEAMAEGKYHDIREVVMAASKDVPNGNRYSVSPLVQWNNEPERTKEEVVTLFRNVADTYVPA